MLFFITNSPRADTRGCKCDNLLPLKIDSEPRLQLLHLTRPLVKVSPLLTSHYISSNDYATLAHSWNATFYGARSITFTAPNNGEYTDVKAQQRSGLIYGWPLWKDRWAVGRGGAQGTDPGSLLFAVSGRLRAVSRTCFVRWSWITHTLHYRVVCVCVRVCVYSTLSYCIVCECVCVCVSHHIALYMCVSVSMYVVIVYYVCIPCIPLLFAFDSFYNRELHSQFPELHIP